MNKKLAKLRAIINDMQSVLVAYSGGVDSVFLLRVAKDVLGKQVLAVTANSHTYPEEELIFAKKIAKELGVKHRIIKTYELRDKRFITNPVNRCYLCKKELFTRLRQIAEKNKFAFVADASNLTDRLDFRPGNRAKRELKIRSPLEEAGFTKDDIRRFSKKLGLESWDKPSFACLASRIPYGTAINTRLLKRIEKAEFCLKKLGFRQARLRHYNRLCRIEVLKDDIRLAIEKRAAIIKGLKPLGYNYITLDLEGYRTGSMDPALKNRKLSGE